MAIPLSVTAEAVRDYAYLTRCAWRGTLCPGINPSRFARPLMMSIEHFESLIELLLDRRPFQPFTIELENGQRFEVDHPRAMATHNGMAFCWAPGGVPLWFDHQSVTSIVGDTANTSV